MLREAIITIPDSVQATPIREHPTPAGTAVRYVPVRDLVGDLVLNPKLVTFVRTGGQVLLSDRYVVWDLAKVRLDLDGAGISVAHLPGLPPDGTYTWHRTSPPDLLDRRPALALAAT
ncbi:hypothetical protein [Nonomuraea sp. JJY05]|uniref:hypothetical protein n=1 Tax=Nonomuraea sp. JJY05 TaxID=3350255 RepID=UPI00373E162C